jgi:heterodisulfide reductase subunit C
MKFHPHEFVTLIAKGRAKELFESDAYLYCMSCLACVERCPRDVSPARFVDAVRAYYLRTNPMALRAGEAEIDETIPQQALMSAFRKYSY